MESLYILIPIALLFILTAGSLLFWAVSDGQFDDLENAASSILFEEPAASIPSPQEGANSDLQPSPGAPET